MTPPIREDVLRFVEETLPRARVEAIAGDASTRRFFRVHPVSGPTRVLVDHGGPLAEETDHQRMARIFLAAKLPIAQIVAASGRFGCLLLEDLGSISLETALAAAGSATDRRVLLERAVDLALRVANSGTPVLARSERAEGPALDAERFRFEMDFFVEHYVRGLGGVDSVPSDLSEALSALADAAAASSPPVLCHRDFHSRNIMVRDDGSLAMVDIQDARWGPDTYDVASLLRDAYAELEESLVDLLLERYRAGMAGDPEPASLRNRFDIVSAQRMLKALGTFGYQISVAGKRRYGDSIPRTLARLSRLLPTMRETALIGEGLSRLGLL